MKRATALSLGLLAGVALVMVACAGQKAVSTPTRTPGAIPTAGVAGPTPVPQPTPTAAVVLASPTPALQPRPTATVVAISKPRYGGVIHRFQETTVNSHDMLQAGTIRVYFPLAPVFNSPLRWNTVEGKLEGDLAERWEVSADGTVITLKMRAGVKFHDGQPLTIEDMVATIQRYAAPPSGISNSLLVWGRIIQKVEVVDASTARLTLEHPSSIIPALMADPGMSVSPKKVLEANKSNLTTVPPVGTGPFKFASHQPGVVVRLLRNDGYWRPGLPYLDEVQTLLILDRAAALAAFRTGRADTTDTRQSLLSPSDVAIVKKTIPNVQLEPQASLTLQHGTINVTRKPLDDERVRRAVFIAIDRQKAVQVLYEGAGKPGRIFDQPGYGMAEKDLLALPGYRQPKTADIAEAKRLLAQAGFPNGFQMEITSRPGVISGEDHAVFLAGELANINIKAKVLVLESAVLSQRTQRRDYDINVFTPGGRIPDPLYNSRFFDPSSPSEASGHKDEILTQLWGALNRELDVGKRKQLTLQIEHRTLSEVMPGTFTVTGEYFVAWWPYVKGWVPKVTGFTALQFDEVWLEK